MRPSDSLGARVFTNPPHFRRPLVQATAFVLTLVWGAQTLYADEVFGDVKAGIELDSNVFRANAGSVQEAVGTGVAPDKKCGLVGDEVQPGVTSDSLTRYFARLETRHGLGTSQNISTKWLAGGKAYRHESGENSQVLQGAMSHYLRLLDGLGWVTSLSAKDRSECKSRRDYLRLSSSTGPTLRWSSLSLSGNISYEEMTFKPSPQYSSRGPRVGFGIRWSLSDQIQARFSYGFQWRSLAVDRTVSTDELTEIDEGTGREDRVESAVLGLSYDGPLLLQLDGIFSRSRSNSFGAGSDRYTGVLTLTWPVFDTLNLHGRFSLQRAKYQDELLLDPSLFVDEANKNSYVVAADWFFYDVFFAELKASIYTQEFGTQLLEYKRTLYFGGVGVEF